MALRIKEASGSRMQAAAAMSHGAGGALLKSLRKDALYLGVSACMIIHVPFVCSSSSATPAQLGSSVAQVRSATDSNTATYFRIAMNGYGESQNGMAAIAESAINAYQNDASTMYCRSSEPAFSVPCREKNAMVAIDQGVGISSYSQQMLNSGQTPGDAMKNLKTYLKSASSRAVYLRYILEGVAGTLAMGIATFILTRLPDYPKVKRKGGGGPNIAQLGGP